MIIRTKISANYSVQITDALVERNIPNVFAYVYHERDTQDNRMINNYIAIDLEDQNDIRVYNECKLLAALQGDCSDKAVFSRFLKTKGCV